MLPVDALRAKYLEMSSVFIQEINQNTIDLYMSTNESMSTHTTDDEPNNITRYGGRQRFEDFNDRSNESGNNYVETPNYLTINARVYWDRKLVDVQSLQAGVIISKNKCKIITYAEHFQVLLDTDYAVINNLKCKMLKNPTLYGLFGKQWLSADFEEM